MKFGKVDNPESVDFTLPPDHPQSKFKKGKTKSLNVYVGCAKWNRTDLKNFYPRGTKDELGYYSTQFNSIELNATFYRLFPATTFENWKNKTPDDFRFFPKVPQEISHFKRLNGTEKVVEEYVDNALRLDKKLGECFLQMHNNFAPKDIDRVVNFCKKWPKAVPLAVEFRHTDWYNDEKIATELYDILESNNVSNIITDTAGRRDLLHMRLTSDRAFIRYVGANDDKSDFERLDDWVDRLEQWVDKGLRNIYFFVHQNVELKSPLLSAYFITKLNKRLDLSLTVPKTLDKGSGTLF